MNFSDSERIGRVLEQMGLLKAENELSCDIFIVNACSVRQTGIDRIYGKFKAWKKKKPHLTILTGCVVLDDKKTFGKYFDYILDINDLAKFPQIILNHFPEFFAKGKNLDFCQNSYFEAAPLSEKKYSCLVPIMTGCNNFCSYCVVPYTRGREKSRSVAEVLKEVKDFVAQGAKEIILLGQNVNSYNPADKENFSKENPYKDFFPALLWEVNQIPKINRIFFTSSHPKDVSDELIDALTLPKMVNYFHLPMQSGDDNILAKMNRKYSVFDYKKIIEKVKKKKPQICLGTDLVIGFPGETAEEFENSAKLIFEIGYDIIYHSMYSQRAGTKAAELKDDVSKEEKKRRWQVIDEIVKQHNLKKNKIFEGKFLEVLFFKFERGFYFGYSREMKTVRVKSDENLIGQIKNVKINKGMEWALEGEVQ